MCGLCHSSHALAWLPGPALPAHATSATREDIVGQEAHKCWEWAAGWGAPGDCVGVGTDVGACALAVGPRCLSGTSWAPRPPASPIQLVWLPHVPSPRAPAGPFRSLPTPGWGSSSCFASWLLGCHRKDPEAPKVVAGSHYLLPRPPPSRTVSVSSTRPYLEFYGIFHSKWHRGSGCPSETGGAEAGCPRAPVEVGKHAVWRRQMRTACVTGPERGCAAGLSVCLTSVQFKPEQPPVAAAVMWDGAQGVRRLRLSEPRGPRTDAAAPCRPLSPPPPASHTYTCRSPRGALFSRADRHTRPWDHRCGGCREGRVVGLVELQGQRGVGCAVGAFVLQRRAGRAGGLPQRARAALGEGGDTMALIGSRRSVGRPGCRVGHRFSVSR